MSSRHLHGDWVRTDIVRAYAVRGFVTLDFTEVRPRERDRPVIVEVRAFMSEVMVRVPPRMPV